MSTWTEVAEVAGVRADRVANGWIGSPGKLPVFRPSGVPECCRRPMQSRGSNTAWEQDDIEVHQADWACVACGFGMSMSFRTVARTGI